MKEKRKKERDRKVNKKGQLTIFIILGLLILMALILLFTRPDIKTFFVPKTTIEHIEDCAKIPIKDGIEILNKQGGVINPQNYYLYQGNKIEYVCYTKENFKTCVMQKPILKNTIEDELKIYSQPKIIGCINSIVESLEKSGYEVSMKTPNISIELVPDNVLINLDIDLKISKENTESYNNIRIGIKSKIYNFVMIASSIMTWETRFGDSETLNYMLLYPSIKVEKKKQGEGSKIYIITDRDTEEKFMFAVRSAVIPPGLIGVR
ncbi:MAG: hypothetical protein AABW90_02975 [Nanoarchaeota archaeon]